MRGRYVTVIGYAFQSVHSGLLYLPSGTLD